MFGRRAQVSFFGPAPRSSPNPWVPLFVNIAATATVDGDEILSLTLNGKMYAPTSTTPEPMAGLETGIGTPTIVPRGSFFFFGGSCDSAGFSGRFDGTTSEVELVIGRSCCAVPTG